MSNKELKTRIQMKNDTADNWATASTNGFIPKLGEPIFYRTGNNTDGYSFAMKIGDNIRTAEELPFFSPGEIASEEDIDNLFASSGSWVLEFIEDALDVEWAKESIGFENNYLVAYADPWELYDSNDVYIVGFTPSDETGVDLNSLDPSKVYKVVNFSTHYANLKYI